jgi:hypothetical protein
MRPYAEREGLITLDEIAMLHRIREVVEALPEIDFPSGGKKAPVSCHVLARAIGKFFHLTVKDGYFASPGFPHSWLINERGKIFDVYPIAQVGGPVLFDSFRFCPWPKLFVEQEIDGLVNDEFIHHLLSLECAVEKVMKRLGFLPSQKVSFVWPSRRGAIHSRDAHLIADIGE